MVREGIIVGHKVTSNGIEIDKAKVHVIDQFPLPTSMKRIRNFLGHDVLYRRLIKKLFSITKPLTTILAKMPSLYLQWSA